MTTLWSAWADATPTTWAGPPAARRSTTTSATQSTGSSWAYDPGEKPRVGKRSREWTAMARTEVECVLEMARSLGEINAQSPDTARGIVATTSVQDVIRRPPVSELRGRREARPLRENSVRPLPTSAAPPVAEAFTAVPFLVSAWTAMPSP